MNDRTDKTLEEYLDGRSPVSRGYAELGDEQPPAALDRSILAAASSAVAREEDTTVIRVRQWRKWSIPAALAATVVVAVPLVVRTIDLGVNEQPAVPARQGVAIESDGAPAASDFVVPDALVEESQPAAGAMRQTAPAAPAAPATPAEKRRDTVTPRFDAPSAPAPAAGGRAVRSDDRQRRQAEEDTANAPVMTEPPAALADLAVARLEQAGDEQARALAKSESRSPDMAGADSGLYVARVLNPGQHDTIERIATLYREGQVRAARVEFGEFLVLYPDAALPDDFPLQRSDAIAPQRTIIREADEWLRGIAILYDHGRIDAARQDLARFLERYPDYELPAWFPLSRDDATPIER